MENVKKTLEIMLYELKNIKFNKFSKWAEVGSHGNTYPYFGLCGLADCLSRTKKYKEDFAKGETSFYIYENLPKDKRHNLYWWPEIRESNQELSVKPRIEFLEKLIKQLEDKNNN